VHLITEKPYGDFELWLDWQIEAGGDSGIYLRDTPQVQIWDNPDGSGGLYNNEKRPNRPHFKADNPPGQWNRFRILMLGERVTVWLNETLVVHDVPLENYWDRGAPLTQFGAYLASGARHAPALPQHLYPSTLTRLPSTRNLPCTNSRIASM
jgi:hypothetical protein